MVNNGSIISNLESWCSEWCYPDVISTHKCIMTCDSVIVMIYGICIISEAIVDGRYADVFKCCCNDNCDSLFCQVGKHK